MAKVNDFCVVVDNFEYTHSKTISGEFYITFGEIVFPEYKWYDYVYPLIEQWCDAILSSYSSFVDIVTLRFMDGPYKINVYRNSNLSICVECKENEKNVYNFICSYESFLRGLNKAVKKAIYELYVNELYKTDYSYVYSLLLEKSKKITAIIKEITLK